MTPRVVDELAPTGKLRAGLNTRNFLLVSGRDASGLYQGVARAAYDLWLERNLQDAELVRADTLDAAFERFVAGRFEALAGLKPRLLIDVQKLTGSRVLDGRFTSIQQAIGTGRENEI